MIELIDRILQLSRGLKVGLLAGGILVIISLDLHFFLLPQHFRIADLSEQIGEARVERDKKRELTANLPKLKAEVQQLEGMLKETVAQLPDRKEIPELLSNVSSKAREAGLEVLTFRPQAESFQDFYSEIPVDIVVRGGFHDVVAFFDEVAKLNRLVNIQNIVIRSPELTDGRLSVETTGQATTFRFLDEAERAKIAAEKAAAKKPGKKARK